MIYAVSDIHGCYKLYQNANKYLKVEKPLYIYKEDGKYTDEILKIYRKDEK